MRAPELPVQPPRWTQELLLLALPCDAIRDAILGDLHEEFAHDVMEVGMRRGRWRYVRRSAGIVAHALADSLSSRRWVSTASSADSRHAPARREPIAGEKTSQELVHARGVGGDAGFAVLAAFVLVIAVVINTLLFSAAESQGARRLSVAGIGGVVVLLACVVIAAMAICAGPRWRRMRQRK